MDRWRMRFRILLAIAAGIPLLVGIYAVVRFLPDRPVTYSDIREHFKYGSTGGERNAGFPYWIWRALPVVFKDKLPQNGAPGYEAFGLIFEKDANGKPKDLPIGVMKRRNLGIDRVFVNCAVCHHSTVRVAADQQPQIILGMPAARFNLGAFENFLCDIAVDERFDSDDLIPEVERQAGRLSLVDRYLVYPIAISLMQQRLIMLRHRFLPMHPETWGPGRVDTFNSAKALFNFPFHEVPPSELRGAADFPSIWNQGPREGMQLHWDGNNCRVEERNKSAAFGTGTTPATIDLTAIARVEKWLRDELKAPPWPKEKYPIDQTRAARGQVLYTQLCANCHGKSGTDFSSTCGHQTPQNVAVARCEAQGKDVPYGDCVGEVTPVSEVKTDAHRLDSYTYDLAANQSLLYAGKAYRFRHFRKTYGYANMPLDGIWIRAPYLHNGSVPTLRDLLDPGDARPKSFYRGYDVLDPIKVGFICTVARESGRRFDLYETRDASGNIIPGNGNQGHEYGVNLAPADKDAIVEYLKTF
ncbi:MAG TPA: cytochrome c [Thermoanaerobaculia bacterium]